MIIYKVPTREGNRDEHTGYVWTFSKREANAIFKERGAEEAQRDKIEACPLAMNKHDIIRFLNRHAGHPDNG